MNEMEQNNLEKKIEPIYEKLAPNEVFLISKEKHCITYATNENGKLILRKACVSDDE